MAAANATETFECTPEQFYAVITDFERYPEFLSEVKACRVLRAEGARKLVEFEVAVVKSFTYRLWMEEAAPLKLSWTLESGDLFKTSEGSWTLENRGGDTRATYAVDASFKMLVPGLVTKALVNVNLPGMMKAYRERVNQIYG